MFTKRLDCWNVLQHRQFSTWPTWRVLCLQICYHTGSRTDPDRRDQQTDRADIQILQRYVARCFPGLIPEPAVVESCMYTVRTGPDWTGDWMGLDGTGQNRGLMWFRAALGADVDYTNRKTENTIFFCSIFLSHLCFCDHQTSVIKRYK